MSSEQIFLLNLACAVIGAIGFACSYAVWQTEGRPTWITRLLFAVGALFGVPPFVKLWLAAVFG